jgi:hypothetical protein
MPAKHTILTKEMTSGVFLFVEVFAVVVMASGALARGSALPI